MSIHHRLGISLTILLGGCAAEVAPEDTLATEAPRQSDSALCKATLSPAQEQTALKLIDDICGDTWCEGDNDFAFLALTCRAGNGRPEQNGSCTLTLDIIPRVDETTPPLASPRSSPRRPAATPPCSPPFMTR